MTFSAPARTGLPHRLVRGYEAGTQLQGRHRPGWDAFKADHFEIGGKVGRVLFLREYASYIKDRMITDLSDFSRNLMLSIDILPVPTNEAIKEMQARILGVESDITRWQQKQNANNNFTATVPYELEQLRAENKEFLDDLSTRDQRMIFANVTLVHMADTLERWTPIPRPCNPSATRAFASSPSSAINRRTA